MTVSVTLNPIAAPQIFAPFTVAGTYIVSPASTDVVYLPDGSTTASPLPAGSVVVPATGAFSFVHPGLTTVGAHTVQVTVEGTTVQATVSAFAAPVLTPTSGGQVLDAQGNVWTLASNSAILENGVQPAGNWSASQLTAVEGVIYIYGSDLLWHSWAGPAWNPTGVATLPGQPSANDTVITPASGGSIIDAALNVWTITAGGQVAVNGVADTSTANVIELAYVGGTVWQENAGNMWWGKTSPTAAWLPTTGTNVNPVTGVAPTHPATPPASTGAKFTISGGKIYDPAGNLYVAKGINVPSTDLAPVTTNAANQPLTTLLPGINHIRAPVYPTNPGTDTAVYPDPSTFLAVVEQVTGWTKGATGWTPTAPTGIVIEFEDHNQNNTTYAALNPYTGTALTIQLAWYTAMATYFDGNPYFWLGGPNEIGSTDYSTTAIGLAAIWESQVYAAIRAGSATMIIQLMAGVGGSNIGTVGVGGGFDPTLFATMTGIVWEIHCYYSDGDSNAGLYTTAAGYVGGGTSAPNSGAGGGWGIIGAQTIQSADGVVPVILGEWGSGTGDFSGGNTAQIVAQVQALQAQGVGATAWCWFPYQTNYQWGLVVNGTPATLTPWGTQVAATL